MTFALRTFSLAFLAWHLGLLFPGLAEPWFLATAAATGLAGGAGFRKVRALAALPLGAALFTAGFLASTTLPPWLAGNAASALDGLPLWFDRQAVFSVLPFAWGWFEGWAFTGRPACRGWERILHAVAAALVFWSQGPYHVTLYPHPVALALVYGVFLAVELTLLAGKPSKPTSWAALLLVAAAALGFLWALVGRYEDQSTASGGGLMKPDLFQFDFAPLVRLEDEITLGENLVLLYREDGPPRPRLLRRLVLETWNPTQGFSLGGGRAPTVGRKPRVLPPTGTEGRTPVRQEYYLVNIDPSSLITLNEPTEVVPYARWDGSSFVNAYRIESLVAGEEFWLYNEAQDQDHPVPGGDEALRGGDDPEIRALAEEITRGAASRFEKAEALVLYLKEHYFYSLKPGTPGPRGALKHFLFEGKKGYCSYFAFSMTLMLRSLGIPARVAVGFATDPGTAVLGFTPIRAYQAHAWVEVPIGPYGWLEFDPTSEVPAPGEPFQFPQASDPRELSKMISEILEAHPVALDGAEASPQPGAEPPWTQAWAAAAPLVPWAVLALLLGINEAWRHRWRWRRWTAADGRTRVRLWWAETVFRARRAGKGPEGGETPGAWALRNPVPGLKAWARDAEEARYAAVCAPELELRSAVRARRLGRWFDSGLPRWKRILTFVLPWWPL